MSDTQIPLFPLNTVVFPGGVLPLRIFEARYIDMISACMKSGTGFGVCLLREGQPEGDGTDIHKTGTLTRITDWNTLPDGLLGITAHGEQRFSVVSESIGSDRLLSATLEMIPNEAVCEIPANYLALVGILRQALAQINHPYGEIENQYADASWVGCRLAELLPLKLSLKQELLQINDPVQRLEQIESALQKMQAHH